MLECELDPRRTLGTPLLKLYPLDSYRTDTCEVITHEVKVYHPVTLWSPKLCCLLLIICFQSRQQSFKPRVMLKFDVAAS